MQPDTSQPKPLLWSRVDARALVERLGGAWSGHSGVAPCPSCGASDGLYVEPAAPLPDLRCRCGCLRSVVKPMLQAAGVWPLLRQSPRLSYARKTAARNHSALKGWQIGGDLEGTDAGEYLASLGLAPPYPPDLRAGPVTIAGATYSSAVLAILRDGDGIDRGLWVQALERPAGEDGPPAPPRFSYSRPFSTCPPSGVAVRLGEAGEDLGLAADPIEGLALAALTGLPVWSAVGPEYLSSLSIPSVVRRLHVASSRSKAGRQFFEAARRALQKPQCRVFEQLPPEGAASFLKAVKRDRAAIPAA